MAPRPPTRGRLADAKTAAARISQAPPAVEDERMFETIISRLTRRAPEPSREGVAQPRRRLARMSRSRSRLTFANVVSVLALFVALSGTATAAVLITGKNVKDGTLTGQDIKNNSVASADVKDRSLLAKDFKPGQLVSGAPGPVGPAGAPGEPGAKGDKGDAGTPATRLWVVVDSNGTVVRSSGGVTASGSGVYTVTFPQAVDKCAYSVTIGRNGIGFSNGGQVEADEFTANGFFSDHEVVVKTYNAAGAQTAKRFSLVVFC